MISTLTSLLSRVQHENTGDVHGEETNVEVSHDSEMAGSDAPLLADAEEWIATEDGADATEWNDGGSADASDGQPAATALEHRETGWEFVAGAVDRALEREKPRAMSEAPDGPAEIGSNDSRVVDASVDRPAEASDSIATALVAEIEAGRVDDAEIDTLREVLGVEPRTSVDVRLERLQAQVADLEAYAAAMEQFLDESGTPGQLTVDLRTRIDGVSDRLDDEVARLEGDFDEQAAAHAADVERLERRIEGVATALTDSVVALARDVEGLRDDVEAGVEWRASVREALGAAPAESVQRAD